MNEYKTTKQKFSLAKRISIAAFMFSISAFCLLFFLALMQWGSSLLAVTISLIICGVLFFLNIKPLDKLLQSPQTNGFLILTFLIIIIFGLMGYYGGKDGGYLWGLTTSFGSLFSIICCPFISIYSFCIALNYLLPDN